MSKFSKSEKLFKTRFLLFYKVSRLTSLQGNTRTCRLVSRIFEGFLKDFYYDGF